LIGPRTFRLQCFRDKTVLQNRISLLLLLSSLYVGRILYRYACINRRVWIFPLFDRFPVGFPHIVTTSNDIVIITVWRVYTYRITTYYCVHDLLDNSIPLRCGLIDHGFLICTSIIIIIILYGAFHYQIVPTHNIIAY